MALFTRRTGDPGRRARDRARGARLRHLGRALVRARAARARRRRSSSCTTTTTRRERSVAITASYQASYEGFATAGMDADETTRLLRLSVELARAARDRYRRDRPDDRRELLRRGLRRSVRRHLARWGGVPRRLWPHRRRAGRLPRPAIRGTRRVRRGSPRLRDDSRCSKRPEPTSRCSSSTPGRTPGSASRRRTAYTLRTASRSSNARGSSTASPTSSRSA